MQILLIHGMGRTPVSLLPLARALRRAGYTPRLFSYTAIWQTFDQMRRRFVAWVERTATAGPYAVVGHSLGNIVVRGSLPLLERHPPSRLVMLAPPNQPPRLAHRLRANPIYRILTTDCGRLLADPTFYATLPQPTVPTTVIAGTAGPRGRWSPFGADLNDGVVAVEETRLHPQAEVALVPALHTFMMNSAQARQLVLAALDPPLRRSLP